MPELQYKEELARDGTVVTFEDTTCGETIDVNVTGWVDMHPKAGPLVEIHGAMTVCQVVELAWLLMREMVDGPISAQQYAAASAGTTLKVVSEDKSNA